MRETARRLWKVSAWIFGITGIASWIVYLRLPWVKSFDFDVVGFAWLFLNAGKLGAFVVTILCLSFSAYLWLRAWLTR